MIVAARLYLFHRRSGMARLTALRRALATVRRDAQIKGPK